MNIKNNINLLVLVLCFIIMCMSLVCQHRFGSIESFYFIMIVNLLIAMACLKQGFDEKFYPHYFEIIPNRNPNKFVKNNKCFLRSKEYNDYKEKINERLDKQREMEEKDRMNMVFKHEIEKLVNMGKENLEYIVNGENF